MWKNACINFYGTFHSTLDNFSTNLNFPRKVLITWNEGWGSACCSLPICIIWSPIWIKMKLSKPEFKRRTGIFYMVPLGYYRLCKSKADAIPSSRSSLRRLASCEIPWRRENRVILFAYKANFRIWYRNMHVLNWISPSVG